MNGDPLSKAKKAKAIQKSNLPDWAKEGYVPPYKEGSGLSAVKDKTATTKSNVDRPYPWDQGVVLRGASLQKKMYKKEPAAYLQKKTFIKR